MTRKDYVLVADVLAAERRDAYAANDEARVFAIAKVAGRLASNFQLANAAFDVDKFIVACTKD